MVRLVQAAGALTIALLFLFQPRAASSVFAQSAEDPLVAPAVTRSADGRSATDGTRTLTVSKASGVDPAGETITVTGSGYNEEKGIYLAFCVVPARNQTPTPCGGGAGQGEVGVARWISSDPPSYGEGLANPYSPGGGFSLTLTVSAQLNPDTDCRVVACAIVTRNDHTRMSDRSQDILIPVTFAEPGSASPTPTPARPTTAPAAAPTFAPTAAPTSTGGPLVVVPTAQATSTPPASAATEAPPPPPAPALSSDGRTVTLGDARLTVSQAAGLDPAGATVEVTASGFDTARGVFVSLCAVDEARGRVGPCAAGPGLAAWISSDPPEYGRNLALPYAAGGGFTLTLDVRPVIDASTDCRRVPCVLGARPDGESEAAPTLLLPVTFAGASPAAPTSAAGAAETATPAPGSDDVADDASDSGMPLVLVAGAAGLVLVAAGGFLAYRRSRGRIDA